MFTKRQMHQAPIDWARPSQLAPPLPGQQARRRPVWRQVVRAAKAEVGLMVQRRGGPAMRGDAEIRAENDKV